MPRLRLPPLPTSERWKAVIDNRVLRTQRSMNRSSTSTHRMILADPQLCDQIVRDIGIREDEVVVDLYGFAGQLSRSLLNGGNTRSEEVEEIKNEWYKELAPQIKKTRYKTTPQQFFPGWISDFAPDAVPKPQRRPDLPYDPTLKKPKLVVNIEPHGFVLQNALDANAEEAVPSLSNSVDLVAQAETGLEVSKYDDRLILANGDPYFFETIMRVLRHPLVSKHLPHPPSTAPIGHRQVLRKWDDPEPHMTLILNPPITDHGSHLFTAWILSAIGAAEERQNYIWQHGRIRLVLLLSRFEYDRMMAKPGELCVSKLTIISRALFDMRPITPKHHVPNIGKAGNHIEAVPLRANQTSEICQKMDREYKNTQFERTITYPSDFYNIRSRFSQTWPIGTTPHPDGRLPRPELLGIELIPKKTSLMTYEQRDEWDYVLRHLMVLSAKTVKEALPTLAFNAETLQTKIEGDGPYAGRPVNCDTMIRELDVEDWARIVDVFAKWPFKSANLNLDKGLMMNEIED